MALLINMTISITLLAIVVLVLRILFKNKIPSGVIYALWAIMALRILLPVMPQSCISVYNYLPTFVVREESIYRLKALTPEEGDAAADAEASYQLVGGNTEYAKVKYIYGNKKQDYILIHHSDIKVIITVWALISSLLFLYFNLGIFIFNKRIRKYEICKDEEILHILDEMKVMAGVTKEVRLFYFSGSPFVKGMIRPIIFIPKIYDKNELEYVFLHELIHIKHKDYLIDYVSMTLICLNWFNPVVWYAFIQLKKDAELYCDEDVVRLRGGSKDYARVLVKASYEGVAYKPLASFIGNNAKDLKNRITKMNFNNKINIRRAILFTVCLVICFATFFTNELPVSSKEKDMGRVPYYFRETIERTVLTYYPEGEKAEVLYLCEDQKNIYVYAQVSEANQSVTGKCFLVLPICGGRDDEVEEGTYYVDSFQKLQTNEDKSLCTYKGNKFVCGRFDQPDMKLNGLKYQIPTQKEKYCIFMVKDIS